MQNVIANNRKGTLIQRDLESQWHFEKSCLLNILNFVYVLIAIQLLATKKLGITVLNKIESIKDNSQDKLMQNLRWWYNDTP